MNSKLKLLKWSLTYGRPRKAFWLQLSKSKAKKLFIVNFKSLMKFNKGNENKIKLEKIVKIFAALHYKLFVINQNKYSHLQVHKRKEALSLWHKKEFQDKFKRSFFNKMIFLTIHQTNLKTVFHSMFGFLIALPSLTLPVPFDVDNIFVKIP